MCIYCLFFSSFFVVTQFASLALIPLGSTLYSLSHSYSAPYNLFIAHRLIYKRVENLCIHILFYTFCFHLLAHLCIYTYTYVVKSLFGASKIEREKPLVNYLSYSLMLTKSQRRTGICLYIIYNCKLSPVGGNNIKIASLNVRSAFCLLSIIYISSAIDEYYIKNKKRERATACGLYLARFPRSQTLSRGAFGLFKLFRAV